MRSLRIASLLAVSPYLSALQKPSVMCHVIRNLASDIGSQYIYSKANNPYPAAKMIQSECSVLAIYVSLDV